MPEYDSLLIPVDFSDASIAAVAVGRDYAKPAGQVHVLHVLPPLDPVSFNLVASATKQHEAREQAITRLKTLGNGDPRLTVNVQFGDPATEIVAAAEQLAAQLIVMPSKSHSRLEHLLLGSVTSHVLQRSEIPVLVLPSHYRRQQSV